MTIEKVKSWAIVVIIFVAILGMAYIANQIIDMKWQRVIEYDPPHTGDSQIFSIEDGVTNRVTVVVLDGLPYDALSYMPTLTQLYDNNSGWKLTSPVPSQAMPVWTTLVTGTDPKLHGVVTGLHQPDNKLDTIFSSARRREFPVFFAGNRSLEPLVNENADWLHYHFATADDSPALERDKQAQKALLTQIDQNPEGLFWLNMVSTSQAAILHQARVHQETAFSRHLEEMDVLVSEILKSVDLSEETLIVMGSHGTIRRGGWGGPEEEATTVPMIMAGKGISPASGGEAHSRDLSPTLAVLMGLDIPASNTGLPLFGGLELPDETKRSAIAATAHAQHQAYTKYLRLFNEKPLPEPEGVADIVTLHDFSESYSDAVAELETQMIQDRGQRWPLLGAIVLAVIVWSIILAQNKYRKFALLGVPISILVSYGLLHSLGARFTFSDFHMAANFPMWVDSLQGQGYLIAVILGMYSGLMIARDGRYVLDDLFKATLHIVATSVIAFLLIAGTAVYIWGPDTPHILLPHRLWGLSFGAACFAQGLGQAAILALGVSWVGARLTINWWLDD